MRSWLLFAALALNACRSNAVSPGDRLRDANALLRAEKYKLALATAEEGLREADRIADKNNDQQLEWQFRLLKAEILLGQRNAAEALKALDQYGKLPAGPAWTEQRGRALLLRGQASYLLDRNAEARDLLTRAAAAAGDARSASLEAEVELRRGTLLVRQNRFDEARQAFQNTLTDAARLHDPYLEAQATGNLGYTLLSESRYDEAIPLFERARTMSNKLGAAESAARADGNLGNCYMRLGDYDNARILYSRAQAAFGKSGNLFEQQSWLGNSGNVFYEEGDYAGAARAYAGALEIARRVQSPIWIARWLNNLAADSIKWRQWDAAEKYNNEALSLKRRFGDTLDEANSLNNAARIAAGRDQLSQAKSLFRLALNDRSEDPTTELDAHAGLADIAIRESHAHEAETEFQTAIAAIDRRGSDLRKAEYQLSWRSSLITFYGEYVDFLMAENQPLRALAIAESSRTHVLAGGSQSIGHRAPDDYRQLARRMNAVLLEYWIGEKQSWLWVITPERVTSHILPAKKTLHPLLESYRAITIAGRNPLDAAGDTGRQLYQALVAPAEGDSPNRHRFVIVPDGDLNLFNFESLPAARDPGKFWIEEATIAVAPSLNYLAADTRVAPRRPQAKILLVGDPDASASKYPRLEFASQEMASIASAMGRSNTTILKGAEARPDSYARAVPARFGFIHFSAHAAANGISPLDSVVILSGPPGKDRLFARDVMAQPLTAELVTVSACRSAGGKTYAGEGLVGFAWAFLKAGAGNVIAGLWDVNDRSTAELMSNLYSRIAAGAPVPDALREAKLALVHQGGAYVKPFYWAPFQVYTGSVAAMGDRELPAVYSHASR